MLAKTSPGFCWSMITMIEEPCCFFQAVRDWLREHGRLERPEKVEEEKAQLPCQW